MWLMSGSQLGRGIQESKEKFELMIKIWGGTSRANNRENLFGFYFHKNEEMIILDCDAE